MILYNFQPEVWRPKFPAKRQFSFKPMRLAFAQAFLPARPAMPKHRNGGVRNTSPSGFVEH
jgi:hypothetical protein